MDELFSRNRDFQQDVFRNINGSRKASDVYDEINDGEEERSLVGNLVEDLSKTNIPLGRINQEFHHTTAISYPFEKEPFLSTRYGDGTFGVWYGCLSLETTIFETAFHMIQRESGVKRDNDIFIQERTVYKVYCKGVLVDLSHHSENYPELISDQYHFTQKIGNRLHREGHPGLLAPSARFDGTNTVIFNPNILSNPRNFCYLTYYFDTRKGVVTIERTPGKKLIEISKDYFMNRTVEAAIS